MKAYNVVPALLALCQVAHASGGTSSDFPLHFERNVGQTESVATFAARAPNYSVFLAPNGATLRAGNSSVRMTFIGANPSAESVALDPLDARVHYMVGSAEEWRTDLPSYGRLEYRNVYPGIDIVYYGDPSQRLEYDFVLHPGSEASQIRLRFEGAERIHADTNGDMLLRTAAGEWRHTNPAIYQLKSGKRHKLAGRFRAEGPDEVAFEIGEYDRTLPLVIDPTLTYSTFLGGSGQDSAMSIAVDAAGNAYLTGYTESLNFPEASGSRTGNPSGVDVYVAKLSPAGKLLYITYLGGSGDDRGYGIAVDSSGAAVVAGWTYSTNFPVVNGAQPRLGGGRDGFVAKLNAAGNALVFSTYLGGSGADSGNAVALDPQGNIYVAGETDSTNFPVLNGFQTQIGGRQDAFLAKFSGAGTKLYGTYLGGVGDDRATAIAVDASGNAYITGSTFSTNLPVASAFQPKLGGGQDAFAAKIGPTGSALIYSTYLGGSGGTISAPEIGNGIAVDSAGCAYIAGTTSSSNFPTSNPLKSSLSGSQDAFVLKLSASGNALVYSTYLGGSSIDMAMAIAVDSTGRAYVAGYTASTDFPTISAVQSTYAGGYDAFIAVLTTLGNALTMATYWGGLASDSANAIVVDSAGNISIAGQTQSTDFPLSAAIQVFEPSAMSTFVARLAFAVVNPPVAAVTFLKSDAATQGSWRGVYGTDGSAIAMDSTNYPSYALATVGGTAYTWNPSTTDSRALQKYAGTDRIASTWYAASAYTIDLNLTDGNVHQVALYCVDWENGGRIERIDVLDAVTGSVLDTRSVSGFTAGRYLVWNMSGHATFRVTALSNNAVVSGIFFGAGTQTSATAAATFTKADITTQGNWKGAYGLDGSAIAMDSTHYPSYAQVTVGGTPYAWTTSTADLRALQKYAATDRIASTWYAASAYTIDLNLTDGNAHQVALYCVDWENGGRIERIDVLDAVTGGVLDTRTVSGFKAGQYLVWNVSGHITFRVTALSNNAVVSGIFFGAGTQTSATAAATFSKADITTQGSWKGAYGLDGSAIAMDSTHYPSYAQVTVGGTPYAWTTSTADSRALQKYAATDRIASTWYAATAYTIDVNLTDGVAHQVALYSVDWENGGRSERIDALDALSGSVLDSRTISGFSAGQYLVWNLSGHVTFRVTPLSNNAVVSGIFFR